MKEGITTIVATPHHHNGRYINAAKDVVQLTESVGKKLREEGIPLQVLHGQEIRIHDELPEAWKRGELLTLSGSRYILIELPSSRFPKGLDELIHEIAVLGMVPIIAHPERNAAIVREPELLEALVDAGAVAQVTTHSLLGGFGRNVEKTAWLLCRRGLIHIVSSDAHHTERRGFRLNEAYDIIRKRLGDSYVRYYQSNASRIISDIPLDRNEEDTLAKGNPLRRFFSKFR